MYADLGTTTGLVPNQKDHVSTSAIAVGTAKHERSRADPEFAVRREEVPQT